MQKIKHQSSQFNYRKVPIVGSPQKLRPNESNIKSSWLLINPENGELAKVVTSSKEASRPKKYRDLFF